MTDLEYAIQSSKELEHLLEEKFGAAGKGLHEKTSSVQRRLPDASVRNLRYIATIRNKLVHDRAYSRIEDRTRFERICSEAIRELRAATVREEPGGPRLQTAQPKRGLWRRTAQAVMRGPRLSTVPPDNRRSARPWLARRQGSLADGPWRQRIASAVGILAAGITFSAAAMHGVGPLGATAAALVAFVVGFYWQVTLLLALLAGTVYAGFRLFGAAWN